MGLYERELKELREKCKDVELWDHIPKEERLKLQLQIYSQTTKKGNLILSALAMTAKQGKRFRQDVLKTGLIGDSMVIDVSLEEAACEKVFCEDQNKDITRQECKERACDSKYFDQCQQCDTNKSTRRLLVQNLDGKKF